MDDLGWIFFSSMVVNNSDAPYLRLISFIIVIASLVQIVEMVSKNVAKGTALVLIVAGSLSLAFMGFAGLLSSS